MAARGLLQNPALFAGYDTTPMDCVMEFLDIALKTGMASHTIHQHLMYMLYSVHSKAGTSRLLLPSITCLFGVSCSLCSIEKQEFNSLRSTTAILDFFERRGVEFSAYFAHKAARELRKQTLNHLVYFFYLLFYFAESVDLSIPRTS
jgi:tRNA-dihydrouridine synthase 4